MRWDAMGCDGMGETWVRQQTADVHSGWHFGQERSRLPSGCEDTEQRRGSLAGSEVEDGEMRSWRRARPSQSGLARPGCMASTSGVLLSTPSAVVAPVQEPFLCPVGLVSVCFLGSSNLAFSSFDSLQFPRPVDFTGASCVTRERARLVREALMRRLF